MMIQMMIQMKNYANTSQTLNLLIIMQTDITNHVQSYLLDDLKWLHYVFPETNLPMIQMN